MKKIIVVFGFLVIFCSTAYAENFIIPYNDVTKARLLNCLMKKIDGRECKTRDAQGSCTAYYSRVTTVERYLQRQLANMCYLGEADIIRENNPVPADQPSLMPNIADALE